MDVLKGGYLLTQQIYLFYVYRDIHKKPSTPL